MGLKLQLGLLLYLVLLTWGLAQLTPFGTCCLLFIRDDEIFLEMDSGDSCTKL